MGRPVYLFMYLGKVSVLGTNMTVYIKLENWIKLCNANNAYIAKVPSAHIWKIPVNHNIGAAKNQYLMLYDLRVGNVQ